MWIVLGILFLAALMALAVVVLPTLFYPVYCRQCGRRCDRVKGGWACPEHGEERGK